VPKLYQELASWWPLLSPPDEYTEEAEFYRRALTAACAGELRSVLELGSGGGSNAFHLKHHWNLTLVDLSRRMLAVSRAVNPECEHVQGDMRTVRLRREFDAVFVHDAVMYMTAEDDLAGAVRTAFVHCRPGGAALFAPDYVRETFRSTTSHGGRDGGERALRYLEWTWDPDPSDSTYTVDYAFLLRDADGAVRIEHDRHLEGMFAIADWLRILGDAGFTAVEAIPSVHTGVDGDYFVFVGRRPA
jgi:SAM-dependent methyltransferase